MSFLKKPLGGVKPVGAAATGVKPPAPKPMGAIKPPAPKTPGVAKPAPVMPKAPVAKKPTKPTVVTPEPEIKEDVVAEPEVQEVDLGIEATEPIKTIEETIAEATVAEVIKEEDITEAVEEAVTEEPKEEPKKKTTKRNTKKKETPVVEPDTEETRTVSVVPKVETGEIEDYMIPVILPTLETWEDEKEEIETVIAELEITPDMNSATLRVLLSDLAMAYSTINKKLTHYKTQYENLTGKDGIIECVKALYNQGKNAEERKLAATHACMNYTKPGEDTGVNLFEYEYMIRDRFYFYESKAKELDFKRQLLITFNGMLNIESRI
jgi:hypothetical protein